MTRLSLFPILLCLVVNAFSQTTYPLKEGRDLPICAPCQAVIDQRPTEVRFGINIQGDGNIYFTTNSLRYLHQILTDNHMGIAADLIPSSRYACGKPIKTNVTNGFVIKPVYREELLKNADTTDGHFEALIGKVPPQMRNELLEGNIIFVNSNSVCYYSKMIYIEEAKLELLPTGLYTDTLYQQDFLGNADTSGAVLYTIKKTFTIPFKKGTAVFNAADLKQLKDSLGNGRYSVRHVDLRSYTSVEGTEETNSQLMQQRAGAVQKAIKAVAPGEYTSNILPAENWIEFTKDVIPIMPQLANLSKKDVKLQLQDKNMLARLEPILAKHRKAIVTVWLDTRTRVDALTNDALLPAYKRSIQEKNIPDSRRILKEIAIRISQERLPEDYMKQVIVPQSPDYYTLESDKAVYEFYLGNKIETEVLDDLYQLRKQHPNDAHLLFNICVLELVAKKYNPEAAINTSNLSANISKLGKMGIHPSLTTRMRINFNIIQSEIYLRDGNYAAKDSTVEDIWEAFEKLDLNDQSRYSLAQFFVAYSRMDLAYATVLPRVDQLDASENLVFYYVNLSFFVSPSVRNQNFMNAMLNAANLNRARFCQFFQPNDRGGASIQLLEEDQLRKLKCENCPQ